jgi:hypothetical protein
MILLCTCLFQESKNNIFTCGDSKNHSWPSPLVILSVPTRENNVFTLLHYIYLPAYVMKWTIFWWWSSKTENAHLYKARWFGRR